VRTSNQLLQREKQRGIAILSVIALLLVFVIFAGLAVVEIAQEISFVHQDGVSNRALVAADAGVRGMIVAIEENLSQGNPVPGAVSYVYPEVIGSPSVSYSATIQNGWVQLPTKSGKYNKYYLISSVGQVNDGLQVRTRSVNVIIRAQSETTFLSASNYDTNQFGIPVWYTPDQQFNGPVYDGGPMHVNYDDLSKSPIFLSTVQTPNTPVWFDTNGGSTSMPAAWGSIIAAGQPALSIGGNTVGLPQPQSNIVVASEAFEGDALMSAFPNSATCPAVCMNKGPAESGSGTLTTGIFVNQTATITGASAGNVETLTIKGSFGTYTIKVDFAAPGTTTVSKGGSSVTYSGVPSGDNGPGAGNGAIYVNGDATLTLGTVIQGDYVLAVPDFTGFLNKIYLSGSGSITYNDKTKDELGLWADDVVLTTGASNVEIDASIIAGFPTEPSTDGGLYNNRCNARTCTAGDQGTLTIYGALMENMRGAVGKFISFGPPPVHVGFDRQFNYDSRLAANPPPFYPVTGSYAIVSWDDQGK
jgi:hypothetical protein